MFEEILRDGTPVVGAELGPPIAVCRLDNLSKLGIYSKEETMDILEKALQIKQNTSSGEER